MEAEFDNIDTNEGGMILFQVKHSKTLDNFRKLFEIGIFQLGFFQEF